MQALLEGAYERGAAVSALFPTASQVYRASGWASCGQLRSVELPTAMLPTARTAPGGKLTTRQADPSGADQPAVADLYTRMARTREGLLSREGPPFHPPQTWPEGIDGMTLVEEEGSLVGYASWVRGAGYRSEAILDVPDLLATSAEAARELLAVLAGWRSVTPTVRLRLLDFDPSSLLLPVEAATRFDARPWMHRPVDVTRAVSGRGWPLSRRGKVTLHLHDPVAPWNDGAWEFEVADGDAVLSRTATHPDLRLHVAGFALLFCGVATPAMLVEAGLLHGPVDGISGLELIRPKSSAQLLDYF
jgi:predicted acetyltransferase